ncbi:MAG TPA: urease accessory UreF family protein, partial [Burkholderiales bacterium]|nr:urease accessory UreF family protein [Burkholderiales bacterium]
MSAAPIAGAALAQLLRLASPMLPVGAYAYSQGMEWAVGEGAVRDEASALAWILDLLRFNAGSFEAPAWLHLYRAWQESDFEAAAAWNARVLAIRETAELRAETLQMGGALRSVLEAT